MPLRSRYLRVRTFGATWSRGLSFLSVIGGKRMRWWPSDRQLDWVGFRGNKIFHRWKIHDSILDWIFWKIPKMMTWTKQDGRYSCPDLRGESIISILPRMKDIMPISIDRLESPPLESEPTSTVLESTHEYNSITLEKCRLCVILHVPNHHSWTMVISI